MCCSLKPVARTASIQADEPWLAVSLRPGRWRGRPDVVMIHVQENPAETLWEAGGHAAVFLYKNA